jgi:hypothetical protein
VATSSSRTGSPGSPGDRFNPHAAHPARVYNYWLGGKDHYEADRAAGEAVEAIRPQIVASARANRLFLARSVRWLADHGVRQFLDVGTGLPAPDNTHEVAQSAARSSRVVYIDNDALVLAHARALLTSSADGPCDCVDADLREAGMILREAGRTLDFSQPVALLLLAVLHLVPDSDDPAGMVGALAAGLAPGSYIVISHMTADFAPGPVTAAAAAYNEHAPVPVTARTRGQVTALFGGIPLIPPGVVPVTGWRPELRDPLTPVADLYAGIGRTDRPWGAGWHDIHR